MTRLGQNAQASEKLSAHFLRRTYRAPDDWARRAAASVNRSMSYTDSFDATPGYGGGYGRQRQAYPPNPGPAGGQWFQPTESPQTVITSQPGTSTSVMSRPAYANADPSWRTEPARARKPGVFTGALTGLLAAALAVGVATLVAAFVRPQASPLIAVGEPFINRTPGSVMNFAAAHFGMNGNMVVQAGAAGLIAIIAIIIGVLAVKHPAAGVTGMILLMLSGAFLVITRPGSQAMDAVPTVIGGVIGVAALMWLVRSAYRGVRS